MDALIVNYLRGVHTQRRNRCVIEIAEVKDSGKAARLIGKKVVWTSPKGNQIKGKIVSTHGGSGALLAAFEKSLPHAVGVKVKLVD